MEDRGLFARRLARLRERAGLTQSELADRIGVTRETVLRWESGRHSTPQKRMRDICRALEVSEEEFWGAAPGLVLREESPAYMPGSSREKEGPYLGTPTNENGMALECPRCGARDFSPKARYCRQCAFPLYNYCMHTDMDQRHINEPDALFCEECARPTFWSQTHVGLEQIRGEPVRRTAHNNGGS